MFDTYVGRTFKDGRYELKALCGRGGMGRVYDAYDHTLKRRVAIKVVPVSAPQATIDAIAEEAHKIGQLQNPHILAVHDLDIENSEDGLVPYIVMDLAEGGTLAQRIHQAPLPLAQALEVFEHICQAVDAVHRAEIVHLDLKPANILFGRDNWVMVADFGISRLLDTGGRTTSYGAGSRNYIAPEQDLRLTVGPYSDIYALGIILHELLTRCVPNRAISRGNQRIILQLDDSLSGNVQAVIERATRYNARQRYPSAGALALAFRQALEADALGLDLTVTEVEQQQVKQSLVRLEQRLRDLEQQADDAATRLPQYRRLELEDTYSEIQMLQARLRPVDDSMPQNPYRGLLYFDVAQADRFFGREELVVELTERLGRSRLLGVIGPSGSGKSSLVRAGLIRALRNEGCPGSDRWHFRVLEPGPQPILTIASMLAELSGENEDTDAVARLAESLFTNPALLTTEVDRLLEGAPAERRLLLVLDQFEEVFTLCQHEAARTALFEMLLQATATEPSRLVIVLVMRADFYGQVAASQSFATRLSDNNLLVAPLQPDELRRAIEAPARAEGVAYTPDSINEILQDVKGRPSALPLLQHALLETWECHSGIQITLSDYRSTGGVKQAIAQRAQEVYDSLMDPILQQTADRILLRLVQPGDGTEDTRRRVMLTELTSGMDAAGAGLIIEQFAAPLVRLLTVSAPMMSLVESPQTKPMAIVELSHEAILDAWPHLHALIERNRDHIRIQHQIASAAQEWIVANRDPDLLYRGARLASVSEWIATHAESMNDLERAFLAESQYAAEAMIHAQEAARQRELSQAQALLESQRQRTADQMRAARGLRRRLVFAIAFAVVALIAAIGALAALRQTTAERNRADEQAREARFALAGQLGVRAQNVFDKYPQQALLLAAEALQTTMRTGEPRSPVAEEALRRLLAQSNGLGLSGHAAAIRSVALSQDGHWLVTGSDDMTARLWDLTTDDPDNHSFVLRGHTRPVTVLALSPDNHWLVTGSDTAPPRENADTTARLWDLSVSDPSKTEQILQGHTGAITHVTFSTDGRWLATSAGRGSGYTSDLVTRLWDMHTSNPSVRSIELNLNQLARQVRFFRATDITTLVFSPDNHWLFIGTAYYGPETAASLDNNAFLVDMTTGDQFSAIVLNQEQPFQQITFTSDSRWLVSGGGRGKYGPLDSVVRLWDLRNPSGSPRELSALGEGIITKLILTSDNRRLITSTAGAILAAKPTVRLWDLTTEALSQSVVLDTDQRFLSTLVLSPDNRWLVAGGMQDKSLLWDLAADDPAASTSILSSETEPILAVAFSPDRHWLAAADTRNHVRFWELTASGARLTATFVAHEAAITGLAISTDSHWLVTTSEDKTARLWNLADFGAVAPIRLRGDDQPSTNLIASQDGHWLVATDFEGTTRLWDLRRPSALPQYLRGHQAAIHVVTLSPNNRWLVTGDDAAVAQLWDLSAADPANTGHILGNHKGAITLAVFSSDSHWVATTSVGDGAIHVWDLTAKDPSDRATILQGHLLPVKALTFSADSHWLASGSGDESLGDNTVRLWNLLTPSNDPIVLRDLDAPVSSLMISPDNRWLLVRTLQGAMRLWRLDDLARASSAIAEADDPDTPVAFTPDSHKLIVVGEKTKIYLHDLTNIATAPLILRGHDAAITTLTISHDSQRLVTGSEDRTIRIWDLTNLTKLPTVLHGHTATIRSTIMSVDGHWLITFGGETRLWDMFNLTAAPVTLPADVTIQDAPMLVADKWIITLDRTNHIGDLWTLDHSELIALACRTAGRNFTSTEWQEFFPGQPYRSICADRPPIDISNISAADVTQVDTMSTTALANPTDQATSTVQTLTPQMLATVTSVNATANTVEMQSSTTEASATGAATEQIHTDESEYRQIISRNSASIIKNAKRLDSLLQDTSVLEEGSDEGFQAGLALSELSDHIVDADKITPPGSLADLHKQYVTAIDSLRQAVQTAKNVIEPRSNETPDLHQVSSQLQSALRALKEATDNIINDSVPPADALMPQTSWASIGPPGADIRAIAINPANPAILYAGTYNSGIFRSDDGGASWRPSNAKLTSSKIYSLAINPTTPTTMYVGTDNGVFRSINGGDSWNQASNGMSSGMNVQALLISPVESSTLYAAAGGEFFRSIDSGGTWIMSTAGLPEDMSVVSLAISSSNPRTLYAGTHRGVYRSSDGGDTWTTASMGLPNAEINTLAVHPTIPTTLYAGTDGGEIYRSIDGGTTWSAAKNGISGSSIDAVVIDPSNATTVYAAGAGVYRSTDGGMIWKPIETGMPSSFANTLALNPLMPSVLYIGSFHDGVYRSSDGGETWTVVNAGLTATNINSLVIDPMEQNRLYAATSGNGLLLSIDDGHSWIDISPDDVSEIWRLAIDPLTPTTMYVCTDRGIYQSHNRGQSWMNIGNGLPKAFINTLAINPVTTTTLYVGAQHNGAFKSDDGGASWYAINVGLDDLDVTALAIDSLTPSTLYAATAKGKIYRSRDGGTSWHLVNSEPSEQAIYALTIDPLKTSIVYAAIFGEGVLRSIDGGDKWSAINRGLKSLSVYALAIDPADSTTIYAGTYGGVYGSLDGGNSWNLLNQGLTNLITKTLAIQNVGSGKIYAGTAGGGVFVAPRLNGRN